MTIADIRKTTEQKMQKSIEAFRNDLAKVRTGRAHAGILDHIQVDYYGTAMPIGQTANINLIDARTIGVQPWEKKMIPVIEKAIRDADLGLNPSTTGDIIRVPMPALTEQRRKELVKVAHKYAEAARVAVRHVRRDGLDTVKKLEKNHEISEDDQERLATDIQKATDSVISEIDQLLAAKEKEILTV